jgi:plasmid stabilization system protein ParE
LQYKPVAGSDHERQAIRLRAGDCLACDQARTAALIFNNKGLSKIRRENRLRSACMNIQSTPRRGRNTDPDRLRRTPALRRGMVGQYWHERGRHKQAAAL